jgi:cytoskeletal protein CcmA (bactofilin family)
MALWNQTPAPTKDTKEATPVETPAVRAVDKPEVVPMRAAEAPRPVARVGGGDGKESLIAPDLVIEGKIEGAGDVRIAGQFKGDVQVQGNVRIEHGAKVTGEVRGNTVIIAGELEGNITAASRVELLETGVLNGDLKAGSLTVAAGSRMRGRAEFGWSDKASVGGSKI